MIFIPGCFSCLLKEKTGRAKYNKHRANGSQRSFFRRTGQAFDCGSPGLPPPGRDREIDPDVRFYRGKGF